MCFWWIEGVGLFTVDVNLVLCSIFDFRIWNLDLNFRISEFLKSDNLFQLCEQAVGSGKTVCPYGARLGFGLHVRRRRDVNDGDAGRWALHPGRP